MQRFIFLLLLLVTQQVNSQTGHLIADPVHQGEVYVVEKGDPLKPALVLVHGLGDAASDDWTGIIHLLASEYHILTLDLPGFGRSSKEHNNYNPTSYSHLLRLLTKKYVKRPFHLVGHSMGGAVALRYAASFPNDVKTLTLIDAAGILHRMAYSKFLAPLGLDLFSGIQVPGRGYLADLAGKFMEHTEQRLPFDPLLLMKIDPIRDKFMKNKPGAIAGLGLVQEDFSSAPEQIVAPTRIIWGEEDSVAPLRTGHVLNALIRNSSLHIIAGSGHVPIKNNVNEVVALLRPHLQGKPQQESQHKIQLETAFQESVSCRDSRGESYTGKIGKLEINNCPGVTIVDAEIDTLVIDNSRVIIENSTISNDDIALLTSNSSITITAGSIEGDVAISSSTSRFDIAGTLLTGRSAAFEANSESTIIFSLGRIDSPHWPTEEIHGYRVVLPEKPL